MIEANQIQKYSKKSIQQLIKIADVKFKAFIRNRDEGQKCISCDSFNTAHASHLYSAGHYPELRFNEDNVHLSCVKCNTFLHGNLLEYRKGLVKKIGLERVEKLDLIVGMSKQNGFKWDKYSLIQTIINYSGKK